MTPSLSRGWARKAARHILTFAVVAFVTALPIVFAAEIIWSR